MTQCEEDRHKLAVNNHYFSLWKSFQCFWSLAGLRHWPAHGELEGQGVRKLPHCLNRYLDCKKRSEKFCQTLLGNSSSHFKKCTSGNGLFWRHSCCIVWAFCGAVVCSGGPVHCFPLLAEHKTGICENILGIRLTRDSICFLSEDFCYSQPCVC